jgi:UDP-N-acetyl-D-galactosamine dehydrogenase
MNLKVKKIGIIGLGYVGLPLAIEFSKKYEVVGFDIDIIRIKELKSNIDRTNEIDFEKFNKMNRGKKNTLNFSSSIRDLESCNVYIITVPTPINKFNSPELKILFEACSMIGEILKINDIVIFESTVYPGCTEEECVPILEKSSGLNYNKDFFCGYSPERINPGDRVNTLTNIKKVTSGSNLNVSIFVDKLYNSIIKAGTHLAASIKIAEASKAIENAQRDVNISFINEIALIFDRMGIDTTDVLNAAATKWNFLNFKPGLVGGHCIGVDPYYLAFKAENLGYQPQVILSGRRVNDNMGIFIANKVIKLLISKNNIINGAKVLILGITFKENCSDTRNSKVVDIFNELKDFGVKVDIYDPHADKITVSNEYKVDLIDKIENKYDGIILAVSHSEFKSINIKKYLLGRNSVVFDTKSFLDRRIVDARL